MAITEPSATLKPSPPKPKGGGGKPMKRTLEDHGAEEQAGNAVGVASAASLASASLAAKRPRKTAGLQSWVFSKAKEEMHEKDAPKEVTDAKLAVASQDTSLRDLEDIEDHFLRSLQGVLDGVHATMGSMSAETTIKAVSLLLNFNNPVKVDRPCAAATA
jgi:hypothetical protein